MPRTTRHHVIGSTTAVYERLSGEIQRQFEAKFNLSRICPLSLKNLGYFLFYLLPVKRCRAAQSKHAFSALQRARLLAPPIPSLLSTEKARLSTKTSCRPRDTAAKILLAVRSADNAPDEGAGSPSPDDPAIEHKKQNERVGRGREFLQ